MARRLFTVRIDADAVHGATTDEIATMLENLAGALRARDGLDGREDERNPNDEWRWTCTLGSAQIETVDNGGT